MFPCEIKRKMVWIALIKLDYLKVVDDTFARSFRGISFKTFRVLALPVPQRGTSIFQRELDLPTQFLVSLGGISSKIRNITRTTRSDLVRQLTANSLFKSVNHLQNCRSNTCTQIILYTTRVIFELFEGSQVTFSQINDMNIISVN